MKKYLLKFLLLSTTIAVTGCGSGGGSSSNNGNANPNNNNPVPVTVSLDSNNGSIKDGATDTSLTPTIALKFSESMDASTVNSSTIAISPTTSFSDGIKIKTIVPNSENTIFTFSPLTNLNSSTKYHILVKNAATFSGTLVSSQFSFQTGDHEIPTVAIIEPSNQESSVTTAPNIEVKFSETVQNIDTNSVTLHKDSISGESIAVSVIPAAGNTYVITPTTTLAENTNYYVVLDDSITDLSGNALVDTSFSFKTGDFTAPTVSLIDPKNNATGISMSPIVTLKFSEAVKNVNSTNIRLQSANNSGEIKSINPLINGGYTLLIKNLTPFTKYTLIIDSGITDMSGKAIGKTAFNFTTGDTITMLNAGEDNYIANQEYLFVSNNSGNDINISQILFSNPNVSLITTDSACYKVVANNAKCRFRVSVSTAFQKPTLVKATMTYNLAGQAATSKEFDIYASYLAYR